MKDNINFTSYLCIVEFTAGCLAGQELSVSGVCVLCRHGFYKAQSNQASCQSCPYGTTTPDTGATSVNHCNISKLSTSCLLCSVFITFIISL